MMYHEVTPTLALNLVLGPAVLFTYAHDLPTALREGASVNDLWAGIRGMTRHLTTASIFVAAATYLFVLYALRRDRSPLTFLAYALFLGGAVMWAPLLRRQAPRATLVALTVTSLGAALLLQRTISLRGAATPVRWAAGYVLFHVLALDNLHWGIRHLRRAQ